MDQAGEERPDRPCDPGCNRRVCGNDSVECDCSRSLAPGAARKTVRFWEYVNGDWVRLRLRDGQTLRWGWHRAHEEGWSRESHEWALENGILTYKVSSDGVDCDGRLSTIAGYWCTIDQANVMNNGAPPHLMPAWNRGKASQRDHAAEGAGY